jgi:glycosyltransferase involved in cell wall biosynthesis
MGPVAAKFPNARCVIAGEGEERATLEEQIRGTAWSRQITLTGFRKDALSLINAADVFVLPSRAEPFGLVLLEAMALGKPVVSMAAGGPLEIVKSGETGFLVPPGDTAVLAGAIIALLRDPEMRRTTGKKGMLRYQQEFTARAMGRATLEVYKRASGTPTPGVEEEKCESC